MAAGFSSLPRRDEKTGSEKEPPPPEEASSFSLTNKMFFFFFFSSVPLSSRSQSRIPAIALNASRARARRSRPCPVAPSRSSLIDRCAAPEEERARASLGYLLPATCSPPPNKCGAALPSCWRPRRSRSPSRGRDLPVWRTARPRPTRLWPRSTCASSGGRSMRRLRSPGPSTLRLHIRWTG